MDAHEGAEVQHVRERETRLSTSAQPWRTSPGRALFAGQADTTRAALTELFFAHRAN